ncbi:hypothetical protein ACFQ45_12115 [Rhodanobacter aciditrophus]|uniref:Uncharacterized protein n=1 Tax=Rhodanobacter aciditrophus TaxID=1623218 RepID=A0ABW4B2W4_9GAMM
MNTSLVNQSVNVAKKGALAVAVSVAAMSGSAVYADDNACLTVAEKEVALKTAQVQDDWSEIFTSQASLMTAKTECFIDEKLTEDNAQDTWADVKSDFQDGMEDIHEEFDEQVANAKDVYETAKDKANTDEALAKAEETYDNTMESITEAYSNSVASLKEELGIDSSNS